MDDAGVQSDTANAAIRKATELKLTTSDFESGEVTMPSGRPFFGL